MKNLTKNSVANVAKVGVASALIGAGLFLSACGGDSTSKAEKFVKEKYPDAKILSFSEIQKEFGLKDKECLNDKNNIFATTYHFISVNGEIKILEIWTDDKGNSKLNSTLSADNIKAKKADCFN